MLTKRSCRIGRLLSVLIISAPLIACGDAGPDASADRAAAEADSPAGDSVSADDPSAAQPAPGTPTSRPAPRPPGDTVAITATLAEFSVRVSPDTIGSGDISLRLENSGERPHTIEIRGDNGMRWVSLPIGPGGALTMTMVIEPGHYVIRSTDTAYAGRGMTADFHVR